MANMNSNPFNSQFINSSKNPINSWQNNAQNQFQSNYNNSFQGGSNQSNLLPSQNQSNPFIQSSGNFPQNSNSNPFVK